MGKALKALESASRRELQILAKELKLCRGNAKSDVIVSHAVNFMNDHPENGEQQVLDALGGSGSTVAASSPMATREMDTKEDMIDKQPDEEPMERVEAKCLRVGTERATLNDKEKTTSKQVLYQSAAINETSPTASFSIETSKPTVPSSPVAEESLTTASKTRPTSRKKEDVTTTKLAAPTSKKPATKTCMLVKALVKSAGDLTFVGESRVRCSTTGHEMMADVDTINKYIHGKRYQKARKLNLSFAKYAPMFVDHPDESKTDMVWCNVTESAIARDEKRVKDHISAPKYQNRLPIWKEEEAAKKKAKEEANQRRAARIKAKRKLESSGEDTVRSKQPTKRKRFADHIG